MATKSNSFIYPYTDSRVNKLLNQVFRNHGAIPGITYTIQVDDIVVVERTDDPEQFLSFLDFLEEESRKIIITLFKGNSNHYDRYTLNLKGMPGEGLAGVRPPSTEVEMEEKIELALEKERTRNKIEMMEKELDALRKANESWEKEYFELGDSHEKLTKDFEELKKKKLHDGDWGELAGYFIRGLVQRNPQVLKKLPGGDVLSGIIASNGQPPQNQEEGEDQEYEFEPIDSQGNQSSSDQQGTAPDHNLTAEQISQMESIIAHLISHPELLNKFEAEIKPGQDHY